MKLKQWLAAATATAMLAAMVLTLPAPVMAIKSDSKVVNLTVNYMPDPMGVNESDVRFGWNMESNLIGQGQKSYQIKVTKNSKDGNLVWDSGKTDSAVSVGISYNGPALDLETRYYWTVTVTDVKDQTHTSAPAYFETGANFKNTQWIIPTDQGDGNGTLLLRTETALNAKAVSARLYITALGVYTAYINGQEVMAVDQKGNKTDDIFNPGWTDYNSYVNYQVYDVTDYISGNNLAVGVMLGKGWFAGEVGSLGKYYKTIGNDNAVELALLAKLVVTYADGTQTVINTNESDWKSSSYSPVTYNDYFHGETYDANIANEIKGWNDTGYHATDWDAVYTDIYTGEVRVGSNFCTRVAEEYTQHPIGGFTYYDHEIVPAGVSPYATGHAATTPVDVSKPIKVESGQTLILDMGQNMVGVPNITVSGEKGTTVTMRHAEMLNDGKAGTTSGAGSNGPKDTLYTAALKGAKVTDRYTLSDQAVQIYQPAYTYHGYRYIEITAGSDITIQNAQGKVITSVGEETGVISTSDKDVNQLVSNTKWSQMGNYFTLPTDCPQRSERCGWTGDAQLFSETALFNFDVTAFLENYVEIMNAHLDNTGYYAAVMPLAYNATFANVVGSGWSDAGIIIPWVLYQQTGDRAMIGQYFSQMDKYMDYVVQNGYNTSRFGDWLSYSGASIPFMNAVYQIYTTQLMSEMADLADNQEAKLKYESRLEQFRSAFLDKFIDDDGNVLSSGKGAFNQKEVVDNAQTALLWVLKLELYENQTQRNAMVKELVRNIKNEEFITSIREQYGENTLAVGFLGVNVILPVLSELGYEDVAYDLLLQDENPSWLYAVKNGATTIWERWDSYSTDNGFGDSGMNSFNHYSYGACLEWMYEYMLGIQKDGSGSGFRTMILQPTVDKSGKITYAGGGYNSYYGEIASKWNAVGGTLSQYSVTIPANTSATLYLEVSQKDAEAMKEIAGVTYIGMTENHGKTVAEFALLAGGYTFNVTETGLDAAHEDGYTTGEDPEPSSSSSESSESSSSGSSENSTGESSEDDLVTSANPSENPLTGTASLPAGILLLAAASAATLVYRRKK